MSDQIYKKIMLKGRSVYFYVILIIASVVFSSHFFDEKSFLLYVVLPLNITWLFWVNYILLTTTCPRCKMLFYYPASLDGKRSTFKFFLNKKCCYCGCSEKE